MVLPMDMRSATVWFPSRMSYKGGSARYEGKRVESRGAHLMEIVRNQSLQVVNDGQSGCERTTPTVASA